MMSLPIVLDSTVTCDGCGACCQHIHTPPFVIYFTDGQPRPIDGDEYGDCKRLLAAPHEARLAFAAALSDDREEESPCSWFDQESLRCRWYEHRPSICREYEVGGESCLRTRSGETYIVSRRSQSLRSGFLISPNS